MRVTWPPLGEKIFHVVVETALKFSLAVLPGHTPLDQPGAIAAVFGITVASLMLSAHDSPQIGPKRENRGIKSIAYTPIS